MSLNRVLRHGKQEHCIDEIFTIVSSALRAGQRYIPLHAFPFPMTRRFLRWGAQMSPESVQLWKEMLPAYSYFEDTRRLPRTGVRGGRYVVGR